MALACVGNALAWRWHGAGIHSTTRHIIALLRAQSSGQQWWCALSDAL
ncbi:MAG: hypothetical protein OJF49_003316 [Ktedonobacterales bacterium]|nr:MAG: hypothetical protein OJF49_003316 [Ktedonobacterales bacterium]